MSELITAPSVDPRIFRDVLGTFVTGVTVVTTCDVDGVKHGLTANSFSSVSLDPPLILWCQATTSKSYPAFRDNEHFAINILAHDQSSLSRHFAKASEDKFGGIDHAPGIGGAPLLHGTSASLECVKVAAYPCGDHMVYIGQVARLSRSSRAPLAYCAGRYLSAPPRVEDEHDMLTEHR
nr:FMN reductase (NADH) NtaB [Paraburkholderia busanensis]